MSETILASYDGHGLNTEIVYGPVYSRRLGQTLGLNILPLEKLCSFNCVYCQLGWSDRNAKSQKDLFPSAEQIEMALRQWLKQAPETTLPQIIVLSGNGEPTLHPDFAGVVRRLRQIFPRGSRGMKMICFTNGTRLTDPTICKALSELDECHLKVDANPLRVDLPLEEFDWQNIVTASSSLDNLVAQCCFFKGTVGNIDPISLDQWEDTVAQLSPRRADLYTISRATACVGLEPILLEELQGFAQRLLRRGIVDVRTFA